MLMVDKPTTPNVKEFNLQHRIDTCNIPQNCSPVIGYESGWEDSMWHLKAEVDKSFPDVKTLSVWLENSVQNRNIHALAQFLLRDSLKFSPADMGKAFFVNITWCVDQSDEVQGFWLNSTQHIAASMIPHSILNNGNQLVSLVISLATLTSGGLLSATRLLLSMKNLYLALLRSALPSPLHTILMTEKITSVEGGSESDRGVEFYSISGCNMVDVMKDEDENIRLEGNKNEEASPQVEIHYSSGFCIQKYFKSNF
jgi:hypothetical protein